MSVEREEEAASRRAQTDDEYHLPKNNIGEVRIQWMRQFLIVVLSEQHIIRMLSIGHTDVKCRFEDAAGVVRSLR